MIIERTISLVLCLVLCTAVYRSVLESFLLANKAVGTERWDQSKPLRGDKVLMLFHSDCKSGLLQPLGIDSLLSWISLDALIHNFYHLRRVCVGGVDFMTSPLMLAVGLQSLLGGLFTYIILKYVSFF